MIQQPLFIDTTPHDTAAMFQALRAEFIRCSQQLSDDLYHERLTTAEYQAARGVLEDWYGREGVRIDKLYEAIVGVGANNRAKNIKSAADMPQIRANTARSASNGSARLRDT